MYVQLGDYEIPVEIERKKNKNISKINHFSYIENWQLLEQHSIKGVSVRQKAKKFEKIPRSY